MIEYNPQGTWIIKRLFVMNGSVFPSALTIALPCSIIAVFTKVFIDLGYLEFMEKRDSILSETQAWSGFNFLVGFLIVFRTSQAYNRFWDGCTATHQMRAEWFDGCSALVAFSDFGAEKCDKDLLYDFRGILVRLFSMLHAVALAELEVINASAEGQLEDVAAFKFDVLDPGGLDHSTLDAVRRSTSKVELVYSWIQCVIVHHMKTGVLEIPAPILSRAFQEIANGMVAFHDAAKITYIPFPFPYAQTCDCLLVMHWLVSPLVISQWVTSAAWGGIFVFIQVFILWALNFIAIEIENPFGTDPNDLDGGMMQAEMNRHLLLLLKAECTRRPHLNGIASTREDAEMGRFAHASFLDVWQDAAADGESSEVVLANVFNFTHGHVSAPRRRRPSQSFDSSAPSRTSTRGTRQSTVSHETSTLSNGEVIHRLHIAASRSDLGCGSGQLGSGGSYGRRSDSPSVSRHSNTSMPPILEGQGSSRGASAPASAGSRCTHHTMSTESHLSKQGLRSEHLRALSSDASLVSDDGDAGGTDVQPDFHLPSRMRRKAPSQPSPHILDAGPAVSTVEVKDPADHPVAVPVGASGTDMLIPRQGPKGILEII